MAGRHDGAKLTIRGLDEFRRELKKLDDAGLIDGLKDVNQSIDQKVIGWAQGKASTKLERKAAASLRAARVQARAQLTFGGTKAAFAEGAEFGANREKLRERGGRSVVGWRQFREWRGNDTGAGYFLFPALREHEDDIGEEYLDAIDALARKAFPD